MKLKSDQMGADQVNNISIRRQSAGLLASNTGPDQRCHLIGWLLPLPPLLRLAFIRPLIDLQDQDGAAL